jgi:hypothetical protein
MRQIRLPIKISKAYKPLRLYEDSRVVIDTFYYNDNNFKAEWSKTHIGFNDQHGFVRESAYKYGYLINEQV